MAVDHGALGSPDQGTDDGVRFARIADLQALRHRDETLAERIENRLLDQHAGIRHADLALMEEDAERGRADGVIDIRVAENDQRAFSAHLEREAFERLRRFDGEMATGLGRACERDHPHPGVGENGRANFRCEPGDDAEEAGRQARLVEHFGDLEPRHRRKFRRLQDEAIAVRRRLASTSLPGSLARYICSHTTRVQLRQEEARRPNACRRNAEGRQYSVRRAYFRTAFGRLEKAM